MKPLLPLCEIPKIATRDGYGGQFAHLNLPFYGLWFANGNVYSNFPGGTQLQDQAPTLAGTFKPNTYSKDCCSCMD